MPSKKAAAKKRTSGKKTTVRRTSSKKTSRKKAGAASSARRSSAKKSGTKKARSKKPTASKKKTAKRPSKKKAAPAKARRKKTTTKKARTSSKKSASKKRTTKKAPAKKAKSRAASARKTSTRKVTGKKMPSRKGGQRRRTDLLSSPGASAAPYQPKRGEGYMSPDQLDHFRDLLTNWKRELMEEVDRTMLHMKDEAANFPDPNDRATQESEFGLELRTRDRERKLLRKIDSALQRIDDGSYGYCAETGEEIGLRRLEARPVATLCVEAQERRELAERQYRDRDDQYR